MRVARVLERPFASAEPRDDGGFELEGRLGYNGADEFGLSESWDCKGAVIGRVELSKLEVGAVEEGRLGGLSSAASSSCGISSAAGMGLPLTAATS